MPFLVDEVSPVDLVCPDFFLVFGTGCTTLVFRGDFLEDWAPLEVEEFGCSEEEGSVVSVLLTLRAEKRA